jgi:DUF1680 family protein
MQQRSRVVDTTKSQYSELKTIPLSSVKLTDRFWAPRLQANRLTSIRMHYTKLVETGRLDNFLRVSRRSSHPFTEPIFNDSDVYKWLEAAAWSLAAASDNELWSYVDKTIDIVVQAQREDGYINTYYALDRADQRWTNIRDMHELYCAGHLMQAAIAIHRCVGDSRLLHSAVLFAYCLFSIQKKGVQRYHLVILK